MSNYISVGITGGIGSGKSYICHILKTMGYPVFFSDKEAKEIIASDPDAINQIKELFGDEAYMGSDLNRSFLAEQIFNNPSSRSRMNEIVHPLVRKKFNSWATNQSSKIVFNEAAILFETGSYKNFDYTVLVTAPEELRIKRTMSRDGSSREEILQRMSAQWSDDKKKELTDLIINNDEKELLIPQIVDILGKIK